MYRIRLTTLDDVDELVRLRRDFLKEVWNVEDGADCDELCALMRQYLLRK